MWNWNQAAFMKLSNSKFTNSVLSPQCSHNVPIIWSAVVRDKFSSSLGCQTTQLQVPLHIHGSLFPTLQTSLSAEGWRGDRHLDLRGEGPWTVPSGRQRSGAPELHDSRERRESAERRGLQRGAGLTTGRGPHCAGMSGAAPRDLAGCCLPLNKTCPMRKQDKKKDCMGSKIPLIFKKVLWLCIMIMKLDRKTEVDDHIPGLLMMTKTWPFSPSQRHKDNFQPNGDVHNWL